MNISLQTFPTPDSERLTPTMVGLEFIYGINFKDALYQIFRHAALGDLESNDKITIENAAFLIDHIIDLLEAIKGQKKEILQLVSNSTIK